MFNVNYNPDVLNCIANLSSDEVFTSPTLANSMLDKLPKSLWKNKNSKFLDPCTKSGVFLREITKRLILGLEKEIPNLEKRINHILKNQVFGIATTELTSLIARRSLYCSKNAKNKYSIASIFNNEEGNIRYDEDVHIEMTEQDIKKLNIKSESELTRVVDLHHDAEKFNKKTEYTFRYLQIFTAICDSFSHGANDVANAIGPFAAMWAIYNSTDLSKKNDMDSDAYWILGLGGVGIALGLFLYGYRITHAIGTKLCKITPSRGVAIELSSALVIIAGSRLKIPLSTTHCQVGATVGVGAVENPRTCGGAGKHW